MNYSKRVQAVFLLICLLGIMVVAAIKLIGWHKNLASLNELQTSIHRGMSKSDVLKEIRREHFVPDEAFGYVSVTAKGGLDNVLVLVVTFENEKVTKVVLNDSGILPFPF